MLVYHLFCLPATQGMLHFGKTLEYLNRKGLGVDQNPCFIMHWGCYHVEKQLKIQLAHVVNPSAIYEKFNRLAEPVREYRLWAFS